MKKLLVLSFFASILSVQSAVAQGWVLQAYLDIGHGDCAIERLSNSSITFGGVTASGGSSTSSNVTLTLTGTGTPSGSFSNSASGTCIQAYDPLNPVPPFSASYSGSFT